MNRCHAEVQCTEILDPLMEFSISILYTTKNFIELYYKYFGALHLCVKQFVNSNFKIASRKFSI